MNDPIYPVIVFFLVVGALVGWLVCTLWRRGDVADADSRWRARMGALERERDQLREEIRTARSAGAAAEVASAEASGARQRELQSLEAALAAANRIIDEQKAEIERLERRLAETASPSPPVAADEPTGTPPPALPGPEGEPDDLKQISGIGAGIEKTLHDLGVYHYHQIAAFTPDNVAWVERRIRFRGRIERENWIEQARILAAGGETEFSRRSDGEGG